MMPNKWRIILLMIGPSLIAATPLPRAARTVTPTSDSALGSPISVPTAAPNTSRPCTGNRHIDRQSELCAQWQAADAAQVSANWAAFSARVGAVAALGVLIALALNIWSNFMTRAALRHAREASQADLKPYVQPTMAKIIDFASDTVRASVVFENSGRTPALKVEFFTFLSGEDGFSASEARPLEKKHRVKIGAIPPQAKRQRAMEIASARRAHQEMRKLQAERAYEPRFVLRGFVAYSDTFGTRYMTEFAYSAEDLPVDTTTKLKPVHMDVITYEPVDDFVQTDDGSEA